METSEWIVIIVSLIHVLCAPGTKVEESFNTQATHDLLFHMPTNLSNEQFQAIIMKTFSAIETVRCFLASSCELFPIFSHCQIVFVNASDEFRETLKSDLRVVESVLIYELNLDSVGARFFKNSSDEQGGPSTAEEMEIRENIRRVGSIFSVLNRILLLYRRHTEFSEVSFQFQGYRDRMCEFVIALIIWVLMCWNLDYDHTQFPGVVPRTFIGPIVLAIFSSPMSIMFRFWAIPKPFQLMLIRTTLGLINTVSVLYFARSVQWGFGRETAMFLRYILCSQFHFFFYLSRPLPNSFALCLVMIVFQRIFEERYRSAVRYATACVILFRCELVLLFGPLFLGYLVLGKLKTFGFDGAIAIGVRIAAACLAFSIPIDSYFWGRPVWPEGEVMFFNVIENRSHEYGTHPYFWYFYSALPRCLLTSVFLVPLGCLSDYRVPKILVPSACFIFLYSFLPHKELRFIIYTIPIFSLAAAVFCARIYVNRRKSFVRKLLNYGIILHLIVNVACTSLFLLIASKNYPGYDAFNKTENLKPEDLQHFDFLTLGTYGSNLREEVETKFMKYHRPLFFVNAFHEYKIKTSKSFPWVYPTIVYKEKAAILKNKNYRF
ncbi:Protein CBG11382 [Caenorhabditis briggsae]|uniref:Mannosyltransferase n=1 Tax=Caenorhabditis briggsae TaxID=6238 RepID=A8XD53_CAEBR|nr:Protein CBG11382 [Caenorhabditis briggsae]CAP30572.2 Protein CBG11382 [Caenorhabditis briggsae]